MGGEEGGERLAPVQVAEVNRDCRGHSFSSTACPAASLHSRYHHIFLPVKAVISPLMSHSRRHTRPGSSRSEHPMVLRTLALALRSRPHRRLSEARSPCLLWSFSQRNLGEPFQRLQEGMKSNFAGCGDPRQPSHAGHMPRLSLTGF